jgi:hypothetical protein
MQLGKTNQFKINLKLILGFLSTSKIAIGGGSRKAEIIGL